MIYADRDTNRTFPSLLPSSPPQSTDAAGSSSDGQAPVNAYFEALLETGVDEMAWDDVGDDNVSRAAASTPVPSPPLALWACRAG